MGTMGILFILGPAGFISSTVGRQCPARLLVSVRAPYQGTSDDSVSKKLMEWSMNQSFDSVNRSST